MASSSAIGGGGQYKQMIQEIIHAERKPIRDLEAKKVKEQTKLQLFQKFKGHFNETQKSLSELSNFNKFKEFTVDLGDGKELASVTIDKEKAKPGFYEIEIEELAKRSAIISNAFESPDEPVMGVGYVVVGTEDGSHEIFVDENSASLRGIASKINDNPKSPIVAEVVRDVYDPDNTWRLILKAKKEGYFNNVDFPEFYFFGGRADLWIDGELDSDNAYLKVDGFEIEAEGNQVKNFFDGVDMTFKQNRPGKPFTLSITMDHQKMTGKVKEFVEKLNGVLKFVNDQHKVDEKSDTTTMFTGDTGVQTIEYRLRNLLHEAFPVGSPDDDGFRVIHLNGIGIEFNRDGILTFNDQKFEKAISEDFDGIAEALTGKYGFGFQMGEVLKMYTRPFDGMLAMREKGMQSRIGEIDRTIEGKERLLERRAQSLTDRFSRLQATLGQLQGQQQYMQAALGSMGGGGNIVSQLMGG